MSYVRVPEADLVPETTQETVASNTNSTSSAPNTPVPISEGHVPIQMPPVFVAPPGFGAPAPAPVILPDPTLEQFRQRIRERKVLFQLDTYFKDAWSMYQRNFCVFLGAMLLWSIIFVGAALATAVAWVKLFGPDDSNFGNYDGQYRVYHKMQGYMLLFNVVAGWLWMILIVMPAMVSSLLAVFAAMRTDGNLKLVHFFRGYKRFWECTKYGTFMLIVMTILQFAFVIPAILFGFFTCFSLPIYIDQKTTVWQSCKLSRNLVVKYPCNILGYYAATVVLLLLGALFFGVGLFVTVPLVLLARVFMYHHIAGINGCPLAPALMMSAAPMAVYPVSFNPSVEGAAHVAPYPAYAPAFVPQPHSVAYPHAPVYTATPVQQQQPQQQQSSLTGNASYVPIAAPSYPQA